MRALMWASLTILLLFVGLPSELFAQQAEGKVLGHDATLDAHGVTGMSNEFLQRVLHASQRSTGPLGAEELVLAPVMNAALEAGVVGNQQNRFPSSSGSSKTRRLVCGGALIAAGLFTVYPLAVYHDSAVMAGAGVAVTIGGIYVLVR